MKPELIARQCRIAMVVDAFPRMSYGSSPCLRMLSLIKDSHVTYKPLVLLPVVVIKCFYVSYKVARQDWLDCDAGANAAESRFLATTVR